MRDAGDILPLPDLPSQSPAGIGNIGNAYRSLVRAAREHGLIQSACHNAHNSCGSWTLGNVAEALTRS